MDAISQMEFSNTFHSRQIFWFRLRLRWSLLSNRQYASNGPDNGLFPKKAIGQYLNQRWPVNGRMYASLSLHVLVGLFGYTWHHNQNTIRFFQQNAFWYIISKISQRTYHVSRVILIQLGCDKIITTLQTIFTNAFSWISFHFFPSGSIKNQQLLFQIMCCRLIGAKPLCKPKMTFLAHICGTRHRRVTDWRRDYEDVYNTGGLSVYVIHFSHKGKSTSQHLLIDISPDSRLRGWLSALVICSPISLL